MLATNPWPSSPAISVSNASDGIRDAEKSISSSEQGHSSTLMGFLRFPHTGDF